MRTWGIRLVKFLLGRGTLTVEEANQLMGILLSSLNVLPIRAILQYEGRRLLVNGKPLEMEEAAQLLHQARLLLNNPALKLVQEQTAFAAVLHGVHKAETPAQMLFARAAIWWGQQEQELLELLARPIEQEA